MKSGEFQRPKRLSEKLKDLRVRLGLSKEAMAEALGLPGGSEDMISAYEQPEVSDEDRDFGRHKRHREPPLNVLLLYAKIAGVSVDVLMKDDLNLPKELPASNKKK